MIGENDKPNDLNENYFGLRLNFYDKNLDVEKKNILHFWCVEPKKEDLIVNQDEEERKVHPEDPD